MPPESVAISSVPLPMLMLDGGGIIHSANVEAQSALGLSERVLAGKHLSYLFAPESEIRTMLDRMRERREALSEHGLCERNGGAPCSLHIGPVADGYALLMVPEANRQDLERQVKKQELAEAVARIALELAHEVKNPLTALRGAAQWISEQLTDGEQKKATRMMLDEVDLIRERIDDFLQLGPRAAIGMEYTNIHHLIDDVCRPVEGVALSRVFDPSLPEMQAHPARLRQAVENLWINALEAGARHVEWQTRVDPTVRLPGHKGPVLELRISNDGASVPLDIQGHLFEPFVTAKSRGSGLGLALVQRVMLEHNGQVRLQSISGRTIVVMHLPIGSAA